MPHQIAWETIEYHDPATVGLYFRGLQADANYNLLATEATNRGYAASPNAQDYAAFSHTFTATSPIVPPAPAPGVPGAAAVVGAPVQSLAFTMNVQSFVKAGSNDQAAVVILSLQAGTTSETYHAFLEAPGANFGQAKEYMVRNGAVVAASSWWSAVVKCLESSCISVCVASLLTCTGAWAAYLLCVAALCGGCLVKCCACAGCNCNWWCRWATGCCHQ